MKWSQLVLATLTLGVLTAVPVGAKEHVVFDFKTGADVLKSFNFFGPNAEQLAKLDAEGLRVTLPKDRPNGDKNVGLDLPYRIRGDFDIVLEYELLKIDGPPNWAGLGTYLRIEFDAPSPLAAQVTRMQKPPGDNQLRRYEAGNTGETFGANRMPGPKGEKQFVWTVRAVETKGRLQLVRTGDKLEYRVTDGGADPYSIRTDDIGTSDVKVVKAMCTTGQNNKALVDIRLLNLTIAADQFPDGVPAGSGTGGTLSPTSPSPETPEQGSHSIVIVLGLFAGGLLLFSSVVLVWYLVQKRSENMAASSAALPRTPPNKP